MWRQEYLPQMKSRFLPQALENKSQLGGWSLHSGARELSFFSLARKKR